MFFCPWFIFKMMASISEIGYASRDSDSGTIISMLYPAR